MTSELDRWISPAIRATIENLYYAEVNSQARFEILSRDPNFFDSLRNEDTHVGLYADHGVVHVRDVAGQVLKVLNQIHGVLIPQRPSWRFNLMQGYGVLLAYFHDIGMFNFSAFGRAMHPEFAIHSIFSPDLDEIVTTIWRENSGNLAWHLTNLVDDGALDQPGPVVLRELLSLAMAHSKSKVPVEFLNSPDRLRETLIEVISSDLRQLYGVQRVKRARQKLLQARQISDNQAQIDQYELALAAAENALLANQAMDTSHKPALNRHYRELPGDAFRWLISDHPTVCELVQDALDTVRALRCADALRQRGAVLRTSGGYEIFISRQSASAVYSLQKGDSTLFLLELPDLISAGEANIASSELDTNGNLRISFHRGNFATPEATSRAVEAAALVVDDIQQDAISSFRRPAGDPATAGLKPEHGVLILLEEVEDSIDYVDRVRQRVERMNPALSGRIRVVPSLNDTSERERDLYLHASPVHWEASTRKDLLLRLQQAGHRIDHIDLGVAFEDVRMVELPAGSVLFEAGAPAAFVYIPMGPGLQIVQLGGYDILPARAWTPLGVTGVIRGAARNATVIAEAALHLLMIPKGVYFRHWYRPHSIDTFLQALSDTIREEPAPSQISRLEKAALLHRVSLFSTIPHDALLVLAAETNEVTLDPGAVVFEKGAPGDSLYIIVSGRMRVMDGERTLDVLESGEVFGEMAILTDAPRMATVMAETASNLLQLSARSFDRCLANHGEVARGVVAILAHRLRERSLGSSAHQSE